MVTTSFNRLLQYLFSNKAVFKQAIIFIIVHE